MCSTFQSLRKHIIPWRQFIQNWFSFWQNKVFFLVFASERKINFFGITIHQGKYRAIVPYRFSFYLHTTNILLRLFQNSDMVAYQVINISWQVRPFNPFLDVEADNKTREHTQNQQTLNHDNKQRYLIQMSSFWNMT